MKWAAYFSFGDFVAVWWAQGKMSRAYNIVNNVYNTHFLQRKIHTHIFVWMDVKHFKEHKLKLVAVISR